MSFAVWTLASVAKLSALGELTLSRILTAYLLFGTAVTLAALDLGVSALHSCADNAVCSFPSLFCKWPAIILSLCRALLWRSETSVFDAMLLPCLRAGKRRSVRGQPASRRVGGSGKRIPITWLLPIQAHYIGYEITAVTFYWVHYICLSEPFVMQPLLYWAHTVVACIWVNLLVFYHRFNRYRIQCEMFWRKMFWTSTDRQQELKIGGKCIIIMSLCKL